MDTLKNFFIANPSNDYHPPVLSYKAFLIYGILLILVRLLLGALPGLSASIDSDTLLKLINQERQNRQLVTLYTHPALSSAASLKSQDMIDRDYFAHIDPDGNYVWPKILAAGYTPYKILGENLAVDFSTSEGMVKAWLDSPTHRTNLLHPDYVDQGLSALFGDFQGRFTNLTTSLFGTLATQTKSTGLVKADAAGEPPQTSPKTTIIKTEPKPSSPTIPPIEDKPATDPLTEVPPRQDTTKPTPSQDPYLQKAVVTEPSFINQLASTFILSRIIFTLFGIFLLIILSLDSIIIYQHEAMVSRSHPSYHLFGFILIVLVSILIWWW